MDGSSGSDYNWNNGASSGLNSNGPGGASGSASDWEEDGSSVYGYDSNSLSSGASYADMDEFKIHYRRQQQQIQKALAANQEWIDNHPLYRAVCANRFSGHIQHNTYHCPRPAGPYTVSTDQQPNPMAQLTQQQQQSMERSSVQSPMLSHPNTGIGTQVGEGRNNGTGETFSGIHLSSMCIEDHEHGNGTATTTVVSDSEKNADVDMEVD